MEFINDFSRVLAATCRDVLPILILIIVFQVLVLRQKFAHPGRLLAGCAFVILGLSLFLAGLEKALFPLGKLMAAQLSDPNFIHGSEAAESSAGWAAYAWVYVFAAMIGFATTIAEPSLIAVAYKAGEVSAGTINQWGLRITVAIGVAVGLSLGTFRIVTGTPLYLYILAGYVIVLIQTISAPKKMIALAYDSGGVTTSTVTVPLVTALGLGLSAAVPGRDPALDGFGLIAFASLFPIIAVMGYAQIADWLIKRKKHGEKNAL